MALGWARTATLAGSGFIWAGASFTLLAADAAGAGLRVDSDSADLTRAMKTVTHTQTRDDKAGAGRPVAAGDIGTGGDHQIDWLSIGARARATVQKESPASAFPFTPAISGDGRGIVIAHYFPPYPLSIDNKPTDQDYYARNYLRPEGENGKYKSRGGLLRDRPLSTSVKPGGERVGANLALEVARAARIGIDAFGVDLLQIDKGNLWAASLALLDAAHAVSPTFKIAPQPDMTALKSVDLDELADALTIFAQHPAGFKLHDGRLLVMPFGADGRPPSFWRGLIAEMKRRGHPIAYAPAFVSPSGLTPSAPLAWAEGIWGDSGPNAASRTVKLAAIAKNLGVSRWFFQVTPQDYRPKNGQFYETNNSQGYRVQWETAIKDGFNLINIATWNDYSESTMISPSAGTQFGYYDMTAYYTAWLKNGARPRINRDALYWFQRRQIFQPNDTAIGQKVTKRGTTPLSNDVELVAFLTKPGQLVVTSGSHRVSRTVGAGFQTITVPAAAGAPTFELKRDGATILKAASQWEIKASPDRQDGLYVTGSTTRPFISLSLQGD